MLSFKILPSISIFKKYDFALKVVHNQQCIRFYYQYIKDHCFSSKIIFYEVTAQLLLCQISTLKSFKNSVKYSDVFRKPIIQPKIFFHLNI